MADCLMKEEEKSTNLEVPLTNLLPAVVMEEEKEEEKSVVGDSSEEYGDEEDYDEEDYGSEEDLGDPYDEEFNPSKTKNAHNIQNSLNSNGFVSNSYNSIPLGTHPYIKRGVTKY